MEWISVKDRLPEKDMEVIVSCKGRVYTDILFCDGKFEWSEDGQEFKGTTHWMPLPEPPNKGGYYEN